MTAGKIKGAREVRQSHQIMLTSGCWNCRWDTLGCRCRSPSGADPANFAVLLRSSLQQTIASMLFVAMS